VLRFGVGNHVEVVEPVNPNGIIGILKLTVPGELLYTLSICFAKLSVLSFYWRIFGVTQMRKVLIVLIVVVICWAVSVVSTFPVSLPSYSTVIISISRFVFKMK
jgi:predicted neutral ceramidase superfamily lipid hydrolase